MAHRIALCHEWVTTWGGSEQVAARLADALEIDDIFVFAIDEHVARRTFGERNVHSSRVGASSFGAKHWQWLLPFMDHWWRSLDLDAYDLVVTSSHAAVNSIRVRRGAAHISYSSTPMRYAWEWRAEVKRIPAVVRPAWPAIASVLRRSDRRRATNVDLFIANSRNVSERIRTDYSRPSVVVYPPVRVDFFTPDPAGAREDFFLCAGRLVSYKAIDNAVAAAGIARVPLIVAGSGPELDHLRGEAGPTVRFVENPSDVELRDLYRSCRALIFPGIEDFGMVPVEAQACAAPVIALARGGVLESVQDGITGVLYSDESIAHLADTMQRFDTSAYDATTIRRNAERFAATRFDDEIRSVVLRVIDASPETRASVIEALLDRSGSQ